MYCNEITPETLERVRAFFSNDRFATENGAVIEEIGDRYAKCSIAIGERHKNAVGGVMGGVHFMLADFAFAVASNWKEIGWVSLSSNISYLSAVRGETLIAQAKCIKEGRSTSFYQIDISDELGTPVSTVTVNGFRKK